MKVAVIGGTGNVGSRLAQRLCLAGHDIVLASRKPTDEKTSAAVAKVKEGGTGSVTSASLADSVVGADAVIIATPGYPTAEAWKPIVESISGYEGVVLDATNPVTAWPDLEISVDQNSTSGSEELQKVLAKAKVFKAFNTLGDALMTSPVIGGKKVQLLFAGPGDDAAAADIATKVIEAVGFEPVLVGPIRAARNLESMAELWIHMALKYKFGSRDSFAFAVQR